MEGRYNGQPEDTERNAAIGRMRASKQSWGTIQNVTACSRATIAKIANAKGEAAQGLSDSGAPLAAGLFNYSRFEHLGDLPCGGLI